MLAVFLHLENAELNPKSVRIICENAKLNPVQERIMSDNNLIKKMTDNTELNPDSVRNNELNPESGRVILTQADISEAISCPTYLLPLIAGLDDLAVDYWLLH